MRTVNAQTKSSLSNVLRHGKEEMPADIAERLQGIEAEIKKKEEANHLRLPKGMRSALSEFVLAHSAPMNVLSSTLKLQDEWNSRRASIELERTEEAALELNNPESDWARQNLKAYAAFYLEIDEASKSLRESYRIVEEERNAFLSRAMELGAAYYLPPCPPSGSSPGRDSGKTCVRPEEVAKNEELQKMESNVRRLTSVYYEKEDQTLEALSRARDRDLAACIEDSLGDHSGRAGMKVSRRMAAIANGMRYEPYVAEKRAVLERQVNTIMSAREA